MRILTRYLLRSHLGPFLFALSVLTGLLFVNTVAKRFEDELAGKGLSADVIFEVFALSLPHVVALTLPMAVLVAVLYAFSLLSAENEVTALKASGVNLARMLVPLLVAATILAGIMVWFNDRVLPETNHRLATLITDIQRKSPTLQLKEQVLNEIRSGEYRGEVFYLRAGRIEPGTNRLWDVVVYDLSDPTVRRTIYADSGRMAFNQEQTDLFLTLHDGQVVEVPRQEPDRLQRMFYERMLRRIPDVATQLQRTGESDYRSDREMSLGRLAAEAASRRAELDSIRALAYAEARGALLRTLDGPAPARDRPGQPLREDGGGIDPEGGVDGSAGADGRVDGAGGSEDADGRVEGAGGSVGSDGRLRAPVAVPGVMARRGAEAAGAADTGLAGAADTGLAGAAHTGLARSADADLSEIADMRGAEAALAARAGLPAGAQGTPVTRRADAATRRSAVQLSQWASTAQMLENRANSYLVEYHKKWAIPVACIIFVLLGAPIGVRFPRGGVGMVISVSVVVFGVYYMGLIGGEQLADEGIVSPIVAMWISNAVFLLLGLWGISRIGREAATSRGGGWDDLLHSLKGFLWRPLRRLRRSPARRAEART